MGLFDPAGLKAAQEGTERNLRTTLDLGRQGETQARGIYGQQRAGMLESLQASNAAIGAGTAASAEELRDQMSSFIGQMMASKGGGVLNPAGLMSSLTSQTVKGLRSVYGSGSQARAGNIINTEGMNQAALANLGQNILGSQRDRMTALSNVQYEVGSSPFADIMGAAGMGLGAYAALS